MVGLHLLPSLAALVFFPPVAQLTVSNLILIKRRENVVLLQSAFD